MHRFAKSCVVVFGPLALLLASAEGFGQVKSAPLGTFAGCPPSPLGVYPGCLPYASRLDVEFALAARLAREERFRRLREEDAPGIGRSTFDNAVNERRILPPPTPESHIQPQFRYSSQPYSRFSEAGTPPRAGELE